MEEKHLYAPVIEWFRGKLEAKYKQAEIAVFNTSQVYLWRFLRDKSLHNLFPDYLTYEIRVDITAIINIKKKGKIELGFIECKTGEIALRDISQLLGYSRVARPLLSIIMSPKTVSRSVNHLLDSYHRYDVLDYGQNRRIRICRWDASRGEIDPRFSLPPGNHL